MRRVEGQTASQLTFPPGCFFSGEFLCIAPVLHQKTQLMTVCCCPWTNQKPACMCASWQPSISVVFGRKSLHPAASDVFMSVWAARRWVHRITQRSASASVEVMLISFLALRWKHKLLNVRWKLKNSLILHWNSVSQSQLSRKLTEEVLWAVKIKLDLTVSEAFNNKRWDWGRSPIVNECFPDGVGHTGVGSSVGSFSYRYFKWPHASLSSASLSDSVD